MTYLQAKQRLTMQDAYTWRQVQDAALAVLAYHNAREADIRLASRTIARECGYLNAPSEEHSVEWEGVR